MATDTDTTRISPTYDLSLGQALKPSPFSFSVIENQRQLSEIFALRYEVYCKERNFLPPESYPSGLEMDHYDNHSIHVSGSNQDGLMIGTVRLVLPSTLGFPLFEHCEFFPEHKHLYDTRTLQTSAEISRLAVSKLYRRRHNDGLYGLDYRNDDLDDVNRAPDTPPRLLPGGAADRRNKPEIILGLYKAMYQASKRQGITHWLVAMEKTLLRLLHRFNVDFTLIGPELDYYGPVSPYFAAVTDIERDVYRNNPAMFREFMAGLEPELVPAFAREGVTEFSGI